MHPSHTDPHRWWALVAVAVAQLMLAVDGTIMNIALPSAAAELGLSPLSQQWTITIYLLGYGGLLLLGGRVSDVIGRRRALLVGLGGVAAASVLGGLAGSGWMLLTARGLQGVFGALMTPAALGILSTTFPAGAERRRAYGIYATIMGSGTGIGVLLGGVLTGWLAGGLGLIAAGMGALALLHPGSTFLTGILPVFLLLGLGTSGVLPAANSTATVDAGPDTGVAAATAMTAQQIGGSLGTAVLGAVATAVTTSARGTSTAAAAALHGYSTAALIGAGFALVAAVAVHRISGRDPRTTPSQGAPR